MSKLEHVIDEIEDYLDGCKFQTLSKSSIIVDKKILDAKLRELRALIPDEIKKYQTIINNKDAILDDARQKAHTLIDDAQVRRNELINDHEVTRQAYEQANEVVKAAADQAASLLDDAQSESNGMKEAAVRYTDSLLENVEKTLQASIDSTNEHLKGLLEEFTSFRDTVKENRAALTPPEVVRKDLESGNQTDPKAKKADTGKEKRSEGKFLRKAGSAETEQMKDAVSDAMKIEMTKDAGKEEPEKKQDESAGAKKPEADQEQKH